MALRLEHTHVESLRVSFFHEEEDEEGEGLAEEHSRGLHVGVEEIFEELSLEDHLLVLELVG